MRMNDLPPMPPRRGTSKMPMPPFRALALPAKIVVSLGFMLVVMLLLTAIAGVGFVLLYIIREAL